VKRPARNNHRRETKEVAERAVSRSWASLPDERLLDLRMCDLGLRIKGTVLEERIAQVRDELDRRGIPFRPHFWISDEWFTPDGIPGSAIPFYLAHPRLVRLEEKQMLEAEGGTPQWCMRLLRHEVGHAICNAYRLNRKRKWQKTFGKSSQPYPDHYQPRPYSKRYVLHLDYWYAQSHPTEDFAETFAVWLTPGSKWEKRYEGWPALEKLKCVDQLMAQVTNLPPPVTSRGRVNPVHTIHTTLREYYEDKRARYGTEHPEFYDKDLRRLFSDAREHADGEPAARFLRRIGPELRRLVARWTGQYQYTIDQVLQEMINRCRELRLHLHLPPEQSKIEAAVLLSVQTMNFLHSGHHRIAL
jgi:hypothetical protein